MRRRHADRTRDGRDQRHRAGTGPGSAYADLLEKHRASVGRLSSGGPGFLVIPVERVAAAIVDQATTRRPRTRVLVGGSARLFAAVRRGVPDRLWDRLALSQLG